MTARDCFRRFDGIARRSPLCDDRLMALPHFVDLERLANELSGDDRYRRLTAVVRKAALAQSCKADIEQAKSVVQALKLLLASPRKRGTLERAATENALLFQAVILYVRATATSGQLGERGSISIREMLTEEQRDDHQALIDLRNRAVAHVYSGEAVAGDVWHRQALYLVETEKGWVTSAAVVRLQLASETMERLKSLLPVAQSLLLARFHRHTNAITALMNEHGVSVVAFDRCPFDAIAFFGSEAEVEKSLATMEAGYGAGLI